jgi:hypothetical protein
MLGSEWQPLIDAIKIVFDEPQGPLFLALVDGRENAQILVLSPPPSNKAFRESDRPQDLLNAGIAGNGLLPKGKKLSDSKHEWLIQNGWNRPQHPFNDFYSISSARDLDLAGLLEHCLESFIKTFDITVDDKFQMSTSMERHLLLANIVMNFDAATHFWSIPKTTGESSPSPALESETGTSPNQHANSDLAFDQEPITDSGASVEQQPLSEPQVTHDAPPVRNIAHEVAPRESQGSESVPDAVEDGKPHIGTRVMFSAKNGTEVVTIEGLYLGEKEGKARVEVRGGQYLPMNEYLIPWAIIKIVD